MSSHGCSCSCCCRRNHASASQSDVRRECLREVNSRSCDRAGYSDSLYSHNNIDKRIQRVVCGCHLLVREPCLLERQRLQLRPSSVDLSLQKFDYLARPAKSSADARFRCPGRLANSGCRNSFPLARHHFAAANLNTCNMNDEKRAARSITAGDGHYANAASCCQVLFSEPALRRKNMEHVHRHACSNMVLNQVK
jgi:hypothetical protein